MFRLMTTIAAVCCISLGACGPTGGTASAGSAPAPAGLPVGAVADTFLPPIATVSPTAKTTIDDSAIAVAWDSLDLATTAADAFLALKPKAAGTPGAKKLADALEGTATWLSIASKAQRASQAENYTAALTQASAALAGARAALADLKGR